jgi:hypothetical protein
MIRNLMTAVALAGLMAASPSLAAPCKDAKGKFVKCPPVAKPAALAHNVVKGKDGKCRVASGPNKGKFTKCA